jgi:hypothetical protein
MNRSISRQLAFAALASTTFFVLIESALRVALPDDIWLTSWEKEDGLLLYRSRTYVGGPVDPKQREQWRRGELSTRAGTDTIQHDGTIPWSVKTNSQGLRENYEVGIQKATDLQFLALGDSWMFGVNAPQGHSLPALLERTLPPVLDVDTVEVINGGIPGANAWHMLRRWHFLRDRIAIDGLILGLPHNAPDADVPAKRKVWYEKARGIPTGNSRIYRGLRWLLLPYTRPHYPDLLQPKQAADAQKMTAADLGTILEDAASRGIPVWLTLWPNDMVAAQNSNADFREWVEPLAERLNGYGGHALIERHCWGNKDTWHPSKLGYHAIAEVMTTVIQNNLKQSVLTRTPCPRVLEPRPQP